MAVLTEKPRLGNSPHGVKPQRRLDVSSLILLIVGLASGFVAYLLTIDGMNALVLVPAVIAATIGATRLTKYEAPRE